MSLESKSKIPRNEHPLPDYIDLEDLSNETIPVIGEDIPDLSDDAVLEESSSEHDAEIDAIREKIDALLRETHGEYTTNPEPISFAEEKRQVDLYNYREDSHYNAKLTGKNSVDFKGASNKSLDDFLMNEGGVEFVQYQNFTELAKNFGVEINPDGSIPSGGILGKNKKKFEKLLAIAPDFQKSYDRLFADKQIAENKKGKLPTKKQGFFGRALTGMALMLGTAVGVEIGHESNKYGNQHRAEAASRAMGIDDSHSDVDEADLNFESIRVAGEIHQGAEIKIEGRAVHLTPGDKLNIEYLRELMTLSNGENVQVPVDSVAKLVLSVDIYGNKFAAVHGEHGEFIRGVSIAPDGTMHSAPKNKILMAENSVGSMGSFHPSFDIGNSPVQVETPGHHRVDTGVRNVGTFPNADLDAPVGTFHNVKSENHGVSKFTEIDAARGGSHDIGPKEPQQQYKLKTYGKQSLFDVLTMKVAHDLGLDRRTNIGKFSAENAAKEMLRDVGKVKLVYEGKTIETSNLSYFLKNNGGELTISFE